MNLTPHQLATIKDHLLMHFILERGGAYTMTYEALLQKGVEFDGWGVFLACDAETFTLRVTSPEHVKR